MSHMDQASPLAMRKMERAVASRQKSCNVCVRGKRKCDKRTPRCTRCAAKGLECVYQKTPPGAAPGTVTLAGAGQAFYDDSMDAPGEDDVMQEITGNEFELDMETMPTSRSGNSSSSNMNANANHATTTTTTATPTTSSTAATPNPGFMNVGSGSLPWDFSIIDMLSSQDQSSDGSELWSLPGFSIPSPSSSAASSVNKIGIPPLPYMPEPIATPGSLCPTSRELLLLDKECMSFSPLDVHDPRSRVGFVTANMAAMHREFVASRALPFIHPHLYSPTLPRPMLAVFAAVAAYTQRTPQNRGWVYKLLADTAREIHREGEVATTALDKLARAQALIVLDTVRIFDGDLALGAAAEAETPQLLAWLAALLEVKAELEGGVNAADLMSRERPPKTWESWVLLECVRRTITTGYAMICITALLKSREPPIQAFPLAQSFTASKSLWEASSAVEFFRAWQTHPQYCISNMAFDDLVQQASPDDIDEFTKLMLTANIGPDRMDHWLAGIPITGPVGCCD